MAEADPCSFSSFQKFVTRHVSLTWNVDFCRRVITGSVALTIEAQEKQQNSLILDTRDLKIQNVLFNGQEAQFSLGTKHSFKGTPLEICLPDEMQRGQQAIVEVFYETSPAASALQWLTAEQTLGKLHPYLFSQCQATHCRSLVPCQDTPAMKFTYYARVSVPKEMVALMSASHDGNEPDPLDANRKIFNFRQTVPIPSYLIAVVVGALESRNIGPRSRVWSEKEVVDKAAYEFAETETMLKIAEDLVGPYVWGQYDLLVLPPSFPYGGMENPCLTYVTPTLLAGDRSLSSVVAHEISHSWTGNLVTNKTWEHFWLNEGHTVYLERLIAGRMFSEQFRQFKAIGGWKELLHSFKVKADLKRDNFNAFLGFLKAYIQRFAFNSVATDEWKTFLYSYFKDKVDILNAVDWNAWMHTPGMPPVQTKYDTTLADACISLCQRWSKAKTSDLESFSAADIKDMSSHQLIELLALLLIEDPLPLTHVQRMQEVYNFNAVQNSEIRFRWLRLCIRAKWEEAVPLALKMATEQGRMKFTRPLFSDVYKFEKFHDEAVSTYRKHRTFMHPVTAMLVGRDLKVDAEQSTAS
ncbi:leukotriene A-4 hydrolase-like [Protopterus annectens]|uniref:leukotriene A-4 hydrolase-like n=1 Tax=Protopterus annectens TaxID=7888 RepID=UPI001CFA1792|nr:leukotriene A-4 hydrolase-like [Protopterus annectens]